MPWPKGRPQTPEHRAARGAASGRALRGKPKSEAHKRRIAAGVRRANDRRERESAERARSAALAPEPGCGTCDITGGPHSDLHVHGPRSSTITPGERAARTLAFFRTGGRSLW
jgi:hypothetical protein